MIYFCSFYLYTKLSIDNIHVRSKHMYGRSLGSKYYQDRGAQPSPEAIYILSKENMFFVLKGEGMAYLIHITIQI